MYIIPYFWQVFGDAIRPSEERQRHSNSYGHLVIARRDNAVAILSAKKGLLHPFGFAMTVAFK